MISKCLLKASGKCIKLLYIGVQGELVDFIELFRGFSVGLITENYLHSVILFINSAGKLIRLSNNNKENCQMVVDPKRLEKFSRPIFSFFHKKKPN